MIFTTSRKGEIGLKHEFRHFNFYSSLDNGSYGEGVLFLNVFVTDELLREYVRGLQRLDYVELRGTLGYHPRLDQDGKKRYTGFILVESLNKTIRSNQLNELI